MRLSREQLKDLEKRGLVPAQPPGRPKFNNRKTPRVIAGKVVMFDSAGEARRWDELELLRLAGKISGLERQVPFPLLVNGVRVGKFVADFRYFDLEGGGMKIEDYKSEPVRRTDYYQLKKRLFEACYPFHYITEVIPCRKGK